MAATTGATLELAEQLIARRSVTPEDAGCQQLLADRLVQSGFACRALPFGPEDARVSNLWAIRRGADAAGKLLVFAGHTDVVPTGPLAAWHSDPFTPIRRDGKLYGRGASDMKSSIAAMVVAVEEFVAAQPRHAGTVALLITSDEEGPALDGTARVCEWLVREGTRLDYCVVGEPTSVRRLGDMIKNGRRGTLSGTLVVKGVQGHVAYPHLARNPIHALAPALAELAQMRFDEGNEHFPPTTFQCSNIHAGTGAANVVPGSLELKFNFRYSTASTRESLVERLEEVLRRHGLEYALDWTGHGDPFLTASGRLVRAAGDAIGTVTGVTPTLSREGGTSDGRFIARICPEIVEIGPVNESIHKIDERVATADLAPLAAIYRGVLERLL